MVSHVRRSKKNVHYLTKCFQVTDVLPFRLEDLKYNRLSLDFSFTQSLSRRFGNQAMPLFIGGRELACLEPAQAFFGL